MPDFAQSPEAPGGYVGYKPGGCVGQAGRLRRGLQGVDRADGVADERELVPTERLYFLLR
jgi:hypothetical protein